MLAVYDVHTTTNFIHPQDTSEPKTIFSIGVIDAKAQAWIDNTFTQLSWVRGSVPGKMEPTVLVNKSQKWIELVKLGVRGVQNFPVELKFVQEQYPFGTRTVLDEASVNALKNYIEVLAKQVENNSNITPDDEKK